MSDTKAAGAKAELKALVSELNLIRIRLNAVSPLLEPDEVTFTNYLVEMLVDQLADVMARTADANFH